MCVKIIIKTLDFCYIVINIYTYLVFYEFVCMYMYEKRMDWNLMNLIPLLGETQCYKQ